MKNINKLRAISNANRIKVLMALTQTKELNVAELMQKVNLGQSALSQHLAIMRNAEIVKTRREAQQIFYSICCPLTVQIIQLVKE